jgi:hypothetical protein
MRGDGCRAASGSLAEGGRPSLAALTRGAGVAAAIALAALALAVEPALLIALVAIIAALGLACLCIRGVRSWEGRQ